MSRTPPRVRFAFSRFLWRMVVLLLVLGEFWIYHIAELRLPPGRRRVLMLMFLTPRLLVLSLLLAGILAVIGDLIVRFLVRPLVLRWHDPPVDPDAAVFHFGSNETPLQRTPARRSVGKTWPVGSLILTNQKLWFFPGSWDVDPWSIDLKAIEHLQAVVAPTLLLGLIRDLPERILVEYGQGESTTLIVPDPQAVEGWFAPEGSLPTQVRSSGLDGELAEAPSYLSSLDKRTA